MLQLRDLNISSLSLVTQGLWLAINCGTRWSNRAWRQREATSVILSQSRVTNRSWRIWLERMRYEADSSLKRNRMIFYGRITISKISMKIFDQIMNKSPKKETETVREEIQNKISWKNNNLRFKLLTLKILKNKKFWKQILKCQDKSKNFLRRNKIKKLVYQCKTKTTPLSLNLRRAKTNEVFLIQGHIGPQWIR